MAELHIKRSVPVIEYSEAVSPMGIGFVRKEAVADMVLSCLSTQFYGGKQVMKKRFQYILAKADKKNGRLIFLGAVVLTLIMGMLVGCTDSGQPAGENQGPGDSQFSDSVDAPAVVLECAKNRAAYLFLAKREYDDNYTNWRIRTLSHCYTYEDFDGMVLQVYQMNCEFWHEKSDDIVLAGGMEITEDGWVTDEYPNSQYLIFKQEGDVLSLLAELFENDCFPGDDIFTEDIRQNMVSMKTSIDAGESTLLDIDLPSREVSLTEELVIPDNSFWELEELQADTGTLIFSTGLQLILPPEWMDRTVMSVDIGADDNSETLMFRTRDETDAGFRKGLLSLRYVSSEGYDSDTPYSIFISETVKILGIYQWQDKEYLLVGEVPQEYFISGEKTRYNYMEMVEANRDIIESVRDVKINTDKMDGFMECGAEDLDWIMLWPMVQ